MGFLKRLFGGKEEAKSGDGTSIFTHEDMEQADTASVAPTLYMEEITEHFSKLYPEKECTVFHELISEIVHIDVNIMQPSEENPVRVLYTTGMSDLPMTMSDGIDDEVRKEFERGEVMMFLPPDWELTEESIRDERNYWPIRLMKTIARFPHQFHTFLGDGHTLPNFAEYEPYADNTGLNGVMLLSLKPEISEIITKDGTKIYVYMLLPLYKEEIEYKLEHGMEALIDKLDELEDGWLVLDPKRTNVCASE